MKNKSLLIPALALLTTFSSLLPMFAQTNAFTYQGRLNDGASPVNGNYDLRFGLFGSPTAPLESGAVTNSSVLVSNGLFTVTLDYGSNAFPAGNRWLEIGVRSNGVGAFGTLSPRQQITPTPYAIRAANFSGSVSAGQLTGTLGLGQLPAAVVTNHASGMTLSGAFSGTFTGNGAGLTNVGTGGLNPDDFWQLQGNNVSPGDILGSTNNQSVQLVANGFNALRLEPNSMASPNIVGGNGNTIAAGVYGSIIGNGFANTIESNVTDAVIVGGQFNSINPGSSSTIIGGGNNNSIQTNSAECVLVGGGANSINNSSDAFLGGGFQNSLVGNGFSSVVGGYQNAILTGASYAVICGGKNNTNAASTATIAGGQNNTAQAAADNSFIGAGLQNITTGQFGMIPGGFANSAGGQAFAAGRRAKATDNGSFVWGDSTDADVSSGGINSVTFRATGGFRIFSTSDTTPPAPGVFLALNTSSWTTISDRNAKKNFAPVNERDVLEKLAAIPVQHWNYRWEADDDVPNLGPTAQDFKTAFYPGRDDKSISTLEFDGVELAAIQGLNRKLTEELQQKQTEINELKQRLDALEQIVHDRKSN